MSPDQGEIRYLRYRRDVVRRWPNSPYKEAVVTAIENRLRRLLSCCEPARPAKSCVSPG